VQKCDIAYFHIFTDIYVNIFTKTCNCARPHACNTLSESVYLADSTTDYFQMIADNVFITSPMAANFAKYCDECICLCVCLSVCLSICPTAYLRNHMRDLYQIFCACCLCTWLSPPPVCWR